MTYSILTETTFFRAARNGNLDEMTASYGEFIGKVIEVCGRITDRTTVFATLLYTEIEMKRITDSEVVAKALEFITEMQKMLERMPMTSSAVTSSSGVESTDDDFLNWTDGPTNLVELAYGLMELGCFNDGKATVEKVGNKLFLIPYSSCTHLYRTFLINLTKLLICNVFAAILLNCYKIRRFRAQIYAIYLIVAIIFAIFFILSAK